MKKLFSIALVLVMLLGCASALAEVTLTYAEVNPISGTVVGDVALAFKDKLEELLRVDTISGYPPPYFEQPKTWRDTADIIDDICPKGASVAEVNWLKEQLEKLHKGTAL